MEINEKTVNESVRRLHNANSRLLKTHPFYAVLLLRMKYSLDLECETAYTDGNRIAFNPDFLGDLSDDELDFVLMHEILHVALCHCTRGKDLDLVIFNIACDIVVNSNILYSNDMREESITLRKYGVSIHTLPDGREGYEFTAEQVYQYLIQTAEKLIFNGSSGIDSHEKWDSLKKLSDEQKTELKDLWESRILNAEEALKHADSDDGFGLCAGKIPVAAMRVIQELRNPQTDWRTILVDFVQEEITDYSFMPPDRRMQDSDFFLPDFNEKTDKLENILFMVDTSGSMSEKAVTACFSEIKGAIEQFDGHLAGLLGFFDAEVIPPVDFSTVDELKHIKAYGGGGTSFHSIFDYVRTNMNEKKPASIIILTDGYAPFPEEKDADGIPVLWVVTTDCKIPWGKVARITV